MSKKKRLDDWENGWEKHFNFLVEFQRREGHCNVSKKYRAKDGFNLGLWLLVQRGKKKKGKLNSTREKKLTDIGILWNVLEERWERNYQLLLEFQKQKGHCRVNDKYKVNGSNVGQWLIYQRINHKKGILDATREKRLRDFL